MTSDEGESHTSNWLIKLPHAIPQDVKEVRNESVSTKQNVKV